MPCAPVSNWAGPLLTAAEMRGGGDQGEKDGCSGRAGNWFCGIHGGLAMPRGRLGSCHRRFVPVWLHPRPARVWCDPKKVLVDAAEVRDWDRRRKGKGIVANGSRTAWLEMMRFKRSFTGPIVPTWCEPQSRLPDRAAL